MFARPSPVSGPPGEDDAADPRAEAGVADSP